MGVEAWRTTHQPNDAEAHSPAIKTQKEIVEIRVRDSIVVIVEARVRPSETVMR